MRGERDVDLGGAWGSARKRWWLVVIGTIVGALAGFGVLSHRAQTHTASVKLYVGDVRDQTGAPLIDTPTVLGLVAAYVESERTVRAADAAAGLPPQFLLGRITARPVVPVVLGKTGSASAILDINVVGRSPKIARAANRLAALAVRQLAPYQMSAAKRLARSVSSDQHQLTVLARELESTQAEVTSLVGASRLDPTDRTLTLAALDRSTEQLLQSQRVTQTNLDLHKQQLAAVQDLNVPRTVVSASTARAGGPTRSGGLVVGAIIGILLGLLTTLLWEPFSRARRASFLAT